MAIEKPTSEPTLPDLSQDKDKPVLHISAEGDKFEDDGLEIDDEQLPVMGSDASRIP